MSWLGAIWPHAGGEISPIRVDLSAEVTFFADVVIIGSRDSCERSCLPIHSLYSAMSSKTPLSLSSGQRVTGFVTLVALLFWSVGVECCCLGGGAEPSCCQPASAEQAGPQPGCCEKKSETGSTALPLASSPETGGSSVRVCSCDHPASASSEVEKFAAILTEIGFSSSDEPVFVALTNAPHGHYVPHLCGPPPARAPPAQ